MISVNVSYCCAMKQVFVENALADVPVSYTHLTLPTT